MKQFLIDLRWIKPNPMGGVETYAILGAKTFVDRDDTIILLPRHKNFDEITKASNFRVDRYYRLNSLFNYFKWLLNLAIYHPNRTIITFNYYTPLFNRKSISTVMDLRLLEQGYLKKIFFKLNVNFRLFKTNIYYAISPSVKAEFKSYFNRRIEYIATFLEQKGKEKKSNKYNFKEFALVISSDLPHKNLKLLYDIEEKLPLDIIIIGPITNLDFEYNTERIKHLGFVTAEEKNELIFKSNFLIFPTKFEGFGYPIIEAALFGKKIICNKLEVFETLFKDFPVYVDNNKAENWIKIINREYHLTLDDHNSDIDSLKIDERVIQYFDAVRFREDLIRVSP